MRRRRRRKLTKFIPDGDSDFALTGRAFARAIERDPSRFMLSGEDAQRIVSAIDEFRGALTVTTAPGGCTKGDRSRKDEARDRAKAIVREYGNVIRANPKVSHIDKMTLRIKQRPERPKNRKCPQTPPVLFFKGIVEAGSEGQKKHVLKFLDEIGCGTRAKPAGAVRLELFVELVAPDEPLPTHPGELGRAWYLGSFSRNPMVVEYPVPTTPMKVVYWARWANATHKTGPFSATCEGPVVGWSNAAALDAKRKGSRVIVSRRQRALPLVERSEEAKLLECDGTIEEEPRALPDAA
jgi:hypothetical protein